MKKVLAWLNISVCIIVTSVYFLWPAPAKRTAAPPEPTIETPEQPDETPDVLPCRPAPELDDETRAQELAELIESLVPLHKKLLGPPKKGDWLAQHKEAGQTFKEYIECKPERPTDERCYLYIQPLGEFTETQRKIIQLAGRFMSLYFNLQVKIAKDLPLSEIPDHARRIHKAWKNTQLFAPYILDYVLYPRLQKDAAAYIAFTATDLYPHEDWNFVYGLASLRQRVGVWSIYHNGDPEKDEDSYRLCLLRTLKMATHETGHMFSMKHCTAYECNMCGCNNRKESDRNPLWLCPECMSKICWATKTNPLARYEHLSEFCCENGLVREARFYNRSREKIKESAEAEEPSEYGR
ncbi:MAG: archaemetzincin [Planctomycetota bacterium]|jgi:archaemetzincin